MSKVSQKDNKEKSETPEFHGTPFQGLDANWNLGHSVSRWLTAIGLGIFFLASIFGPMFFSEGGIGTLGAIFFWVVLWFGWPGHLAGWKPKAGYVFMQLFFCLTFIFLNEWLSPRFYSALIDAGLFKLFYLVMLGLWLKFGHWFFNWMAKRYL